MKSIDLILNNLTFVVVDAAQSPWLPLRSRLREAIVEMKTSGGKMTFADFCSIYMEFCTTAEQPTSLLRDPWKQFVGNPNFHDRPKCDVTN